MLIRLSGSKLACTTQVHLNPRRGAISTRPAVDSPATESHTDDELHLSFIALVGDLTADT